MEVKDLLQSGLSFRLTRFVLLILFAILPDYIWISDRHLRTLVFSQHSARFLINLPLHTCPIPAAFILKRSVAPRRVEHRDDPLTFPLPCPLPPLLHGGCFLS